MAPTPLDLAEDFALHLPPRPGWLRLVRDEWVLTTGLSGATVARIRLAEDTVEDAVAEIRALLAPENVERSTWWCGSRATPAGLPARLESLGFVQEDVLASLVLDSPPDGEPAAEVRRVETLDEYRIGAEIDWEASAVDEALRDRRRARLEDTWRTLREQRMVHYLGFLDGEPVSHARACFLDDGVMLMGGSTVPRARGRGVYVSLVHARWHDAVARGTPLLAVQAGPMSRPILERLGFRNLGETRLLVDPLV